MTDVRVASELVQLLRMERFRRLFTVRVVSQSADGMFQVGLATLFFFSPERQTSAGQVAIAFAVLLAPFTIVGPWAGVLLDRWRRRQVLVVANLVRAVLCGAIVVVMAVTPPDEALGLPVYVLALLTLSVNRFLLSALSAGLPRVVAGPLLLTANSLTPTLGAVAAGVGAVGGLALGVALPQGRATDAGSVVVAALGMLMAAALALRLRADELGPGPVVAGVRASTQLRRVGRELADGARHLARRRTPGQALLAMTLGRFLFGVALVASILVSRQILADPEDASAGLSTFALVAGVTGAGFALAVVLTPVLSPVIGPQRWIAACLGLGAVAQLFLVPEPSLVLVCLAGGLLGMSSQAAKIAVDTVVHRDTADEFRGRAFALYDVLYNAALVGAAALAALLLPDDGHAPALMLAVGAAYVVGALLMATRAARTPPAPTVRSPDR